MRISIMMMSYNCLEAVFRNVNTYDITPCATGTDESHMSVVLNSPSINKSLGPLFEYPSHSPKISRSWVNSKGMGQRPKPDFLRQPLFRLGEVHAWWMYLLSSPKHQVWHHVLHHLPKSVDDLLKCLTRLMMILCHHFKIPSDPEAGER